MIRAYQGDNWSEIPIYPDGLLDPNTVEAAMRMVEKSLGR